MAVVKDWVAEAAKELAMHFSFGGGRDSYVTDEQRVNVAHNYAAIINKHCPFKKDVAYMPVPRCDTCVHWKRHDEIMAFGECSLLVHGNYARERGISRYAVADNQEHDAEFITRETFGCVQWERK